jgi:asparagine synthase (glutamine-hydrolysing)
MGDEEQYIEGVREKLMEAVQLRLEADVPVACYLSGGIDSCAILGLSPPR